MNSAVLLILEPLSDPLDHVPRVVFEALSVVHRFGYLRSLGNTISLGFGIRRTILTLNGVFLLTLWAI